MLRVPLDGFWAVAVSVASNEVNALYTIELSEVREAETVVLEELDRSVQEAAGFKTSLQEAQEVNQNLSSRVQELEVDQAEKQTRYETTVSELRAQLEEARREEMNAKIETATARLGALEEALAAIKQELVSNRQTLDSSDKLGNSNL